MILSLTNPGRLLLDFMVSLAIFFIVLGVSTYCIVKRTDTKIERAFNESAQTFCRNTEQLIAKEKNLRKMDHAFRMLILIEALKIVKRISNNHLANHTESKVARRAKKSIADSTDRLRESMQIDVNNVMKEMMEETDEKK
jgi:hypothetical protein